MKKHIITVSGFPGSGKSSSAREIARRLGYEYFSAGDLFRHMAAERGLSVMELNLAAENQREVDDKVDARIRALGKEKDSFVMDSRTAFHWIPDSFKVFLDLEPQIAADRIFSHITQEGRVSQSALSSDEVLSDTMRRVESERKRYESLYGIDFMKKDNFDLIVDTKENNLEQVIQIVIDNYQDWINP